MKHFNTKTKNRSYMKKQLQKILLRTSYILLVAVLQLVPHGAVAQSGRVSGVVTNVSNQPIAGATITVKQSNTSVATDADGKFSIQANSGQTLVVSIVGYETTELKLSKTTDLNIQLTTKVGGL